MAKYQVYGIGNALVDMEYRVDENFLNQHGIQKSLMTLIDLKREETLLAALKNYSPHRGCGGSAANTMIAVSQLGGNVFYSCKVANDETGDFFVGDLLALGVSNNLSNNRDAGTTGKCLVLITPDGERTMNTYLGITERFSINEVKEEELKQSDYLYIEGYLVPSSSAKQAAIRAREMAATHRLKTAITFSDPGIVTHFKSGLEEMMGKGVDLIFCNEQEALSISGEKDLQRAGEYLKKWGKQWVITLGEKGAMFFDGGKIEMVPTQSVKAVDTNGAGDIFAGAFLYAITSGKNFTQAAKLACACSKKLVSQFGARLKMDEILSIKKVVLGE